MKIQGTVCLASPALIFPENALIRQFDDEMLLGAFLLVKPVTRLMLYGLGTVPFRAVYAGYGGFLRRRSDHPPGSAAEQDARVCPGRRDSRMPAVQHTDDARPIPLSLTVYQGANGAFTLCGEACQITLL